MPVSLAEKRCNMSQVRPTKPVPSMIPETYGEAADLLDDWNYESLPDGDGIIKAIAMGIRALNQCHDMGLTGNELEGKEEKLEYGSFCPECGVRMKVAGAGGYTKQYICPMCKTTWEYDGEEGCYRVVEAGFFKTEV